MRVLIIIVALYLGFSPWPACGQLANPVPHPHCQIQSTIFEKWNAEQITNEWVRLTIVPQLGGRLMQVSFGGHSYLFVNPKYKGQYFPPSEGDAKGRWFNYGGDKIWPLPEGAQDEQHWPGPVSDALDDGVYNLKIISQDAMCAVRLEGPADPRTGLQYSREISIGTDSPEISFHAVMKNASSRAIQWAMQSVSQYDTADPQKPGAYNHDFWAFTPENPHSAYWEGHHVRIGPSDDPSFDGKDGLFTLHWLYLQSEVLLDSSSGWIAIVDGSTRYAMVERFHYREGANYPGKATVIFYKNGPVLQLDDSGMPFMTSSKPENEPFYMEAELNSPVVRLEPGETYSMDTKWFPARAGREFITVTDAGIVGRSLTVSTTASGLVLSGSFGVFFSGNLVLHLYDSRGVEEGAIALQSVSPLDVVDLHQEIQAPSRISRVSLHLMDQYGGDRGSLGEASVVKMERGS